MKTMQQKKYNVHMTLAFCLYAAGLAYTLIMILTKGQESLEDLFGSTISILLMTAPFILGLVYIVVVALFGFIHQDEMLKGISGQSLSIGFLVGGLFSLGYGVLEIILHLPSLNGLIYWTVMGVSWAGAHVIILKRHQ